MEERKFELDIRQWLDLSKGGKAKEAKDFYYENLFDTVIERFERNNQQVISGSSVDVLISILGFSPEPIVLGAKLLNPKIHIIIHDACVSLNEENNRIIGKYLTDYHFVELQDETFSCIYDTLKEQLSIHPAQHCVINITGGKKSMSASAGIFARDFFCDLIYVDYSKYDPSTRRPEPGSEFLNLVYSPYRDLPELFHK